jgi:hypothetical protein
MLGAVPLDFWDGVFDLHGYDASRVVKNNDDAAVAVYQT